MRARRFGASSVELSPLAFGTMRLNERGLDDRASEVLIRESLARGITTFHSSSEYEPFARFCALLLRLGERRREMQHVVKLAEPHFGDPSFDESRLRAKVDAYLSNLGAARIDVVQWMWRGDLKDEEARLAGFSRQRDEIQAAFDALRVAGKIGAVATFPYTLGFADAVLSARFGGGLAVYLNPIEHEMQGRVDRADALRAGVIAIRPLAAGKAAAAGIDAATCLRDVLGRPAVSTAVVTYSSVEHMEELVHAASAVTELSHPESAPAR
jgi:aryl-alcohol dehydrogenase-like predicted oxidoreductase